MDVTTQLKPFTIWKIEVRIIIENFITDETTAVNVKRFDVSSHLKSLFALQGFLTCHSENH